MKHFTFLLLMMLNAANACDDSDLFPDKLFPEVVISTNIGDIVVELDRNRAPITVNNFLKYVKARLYVNTIIHRVEENFVIQGGGYDVDFKEINECGKIFNESGNGLKNKKGSIAMARHDDPHSATSQFYFNLVDSESLNPNPKRWGYAVFGEVVDGMEVLHAMAKVKTGYSDHLQSENVPLEFITIKNITVN